MNALILGGQSPRHADWVRQVAVTLQPHFGVVEYLDYAHWQKNSADIDLEHEIVQAGVTAAGLNEYVVVAKSIGTVLTTLAVARGALKPARCLFMGFPLSVVETSYPGVADALPMLPPTVFLHNDTDPIGSANDVRDYLHTHPPASYSFVSRPGNSHNYVDYELLASLAIKE